MATESSPLDPSLELLDRLRDEASERVGRELDDLRAHLIKCCEHSIERLRDCGFVSLESVTPVVEALAGMAASERERANHLDNLLRSTETELEGLRAEHQALTDSSRQADTVDCRDWPFGSSRSWIRPGKPRRRRLRHAADLWRRAHAFSR